MAKKYIRVGGGTGWKDSPSTNTPRNAFNLNIMDKGIDDLDNAIVEQQAQIDALVVYGDSSPAVAQAIAGTGYITLKERLDTEHNEVTSELASKSNQSALDAEVTNRTNAVNTEKSERLAEVATERARINSLSSLDTGSTTGDAELIDGRIDMYGYKQPTLGENIRNMYKVWKSGLTNVVLDNWEVGNINGADGTNLTNAARLRTGYVDFTGNKQVTITPLNGYVFFVFSYDASHAYKGVAINNSSISQSFAPLTGYYYRILLYKAGIASELVSNSTNLVIIATVDSEVIDSLESELRAKIDTDVTTLKQSIMSGVSSVTFTDWVQGNIVDATGADATATDKIRTGFHQFDNGETLTFDIVPAYLFVYKYNSSHVFESMIVNTVKHGSVVADGSCFYRFKIWNGATLTPPYASNLSLTVTETPANINTIKNEIKLLKGDAALSVPNEYFVVKGQTLELFKYGMFYTKNPYLENEYIVRINNISSYITVYSDRFIISVPTGYVGTTLNANIVLYDKNNKVIEAKSVVFRVVDSSAITATNPSKTIAFFGDSLTAQMTLTDEIVNLLRNTNGLTNTKLVGKYTSTNNSNSKYTANGGYAWDNYLYDPSALPPECPNNWLWSTSTGDISFTEFMSNYGAGVTLDYVVCLLGWNDFESGVWAANYSISNLETKIRLFISKLHLQYPSAKVLLVGYHMAYPGYSLSHGDNLPYTRNKFIYDLTNLYNKLASEMSYVKTCHTASQFDVFHNLVFTTRNANKRSTAQVTYCQDTVHPADIGYYQYADAETNAILYMMQT